jgi:hypothetical protein
LGFGLVWESRNGKQKKGAWQRAQHSQKGSRRVTRRSARSRLQTENF